MDEEPLPGRYRRLEGLDAEWGNPAFEKADVRILVTRLSGYADVDRSTSHLFLFSSARKALGSAFLDFSFLPSRSDRKTLSASALPLLYGWASGRRANSFDLILISNSFGLELLNLLPLLRSCAIPPTAAERAAAGSPLLVLGGSNAFGSQALWEDPLDGRGGALVDAVFFGEAEAQLPAMLRAFLNARGSLSETEDKAEARSSLLTAMAEASPGLSVPGLRPRATQAVLRLEEDGEGENWETMVPVMDGEEALTARLGISRGCPAFCSFCMEGWERKPWREPPLKAVLERARRLRASTGASSLEIASYNFNARSDIALLLDGLTRIFPKVGMMSQRADILYATPGLLELEMALGKRSFTLGVEGISGRLRAFYRKGLDEAVLKGLLERLLRSKAREIKLFFVLSGIENEGDMEEYSSFLAWLHGRRAELHPGARVLLSASYLMRMGGTPLAWMALDLQMDRLSALGSALQARSAAGGFEFRLSSHPDEHCLGQLLSLGGRGLRDLLLHLADRGILYDGSLPKGAWAEARRFLWPEGEIPASFVNEKDGDFAFPLAFVKRTVDPSWTHARWEALSAFLAGGGEEAPSCLSSACLACGACPPGSPERRAILNHGVAAAPRPLTEGISARLKAQACALPFHILAEVPESLSRAGREWLCAWISRALFRADPSQVENIISVEEALFSDEAGRAAFPAFYGMAIFSLRALEPALALAAAKKAGFSPVGGARGKGAGLTIKSFDLELALPGISRIQAEGAFSAFLSAVSIPATLSRSGGSTTWAIGPKALKRKVLSAAELIEGPSASSPSPPLLRLRALSHFDPRVFLKALGEDGASALPSFRVLSLDLMPS